MNATGLAPLVLMGLSAFGASALSFGTRNMEALDQAFGNALATILFVGALAFGAIFVWAALFSSYGIIP